MSEVGHKLEASVASARTAYHRLVLVIGSSGTGKTDLLRSFAKQHNLPYLNINLLLSQRMLELTRGQRARKVDALFEELVEQSAAETVVLDNMEILFDPALQVEPLRMLQSLSRNRTVVASWNGTFQDGALTYAEPHHPEYRCYRELNAITVVMEGAVSSGL